MNFLNEPVTNWLSAIGYRLSAIGYRLSAIGYRLILGLLLSAFATTSFAVDCKVNDKNISDEYVGDCLNGLAHGRGKAKGRDTYEGEFRQGNTHGKGIYTWISGSRYEGDWLNGSRHGKGILNFVIGTTYEGGWLNNQYSGYGKLTFSRNNKEVESWDGKGIWFGDKYVVEGMFEGRRITLSCSSPQNCKQEQAKRDAQEKREQEARRADDDRRRAYENSPAGVAARQGRQMCEAQKQTCFASCPPYNDRLTAFGANNAHFQCNSRCGQISCN